MTHVLQRLFKVLYLLIVIIGTISVASLVVLNDSVVRLNLPFLGVYEFSLGMTVVIAFVLGVATALILTSFAGINTQLRLRNVSKKLRIKEQSE